jgi:hypothetical protein
MFRLFPFNKFRHDGLVHALLPGNSSGRFIDGTLSCSSFEKEAIFHFDICFTGLLYRKISLIIREFGEQRLTTERRVRGAGGAATSLRQAQPARVFARADRRPPPAPAIMLTGLSP